MDLGTIAAAVLRPGAPIGGREEKIVLSLRLVGSLLDGRASLAEVSPDLAREVRAAAPNAEATLILPAGPGPARIDLGGRQFVLPGALRDALVAMLNGRAQEVTARAVALPPNPAAAGNEMNLPTQALVQSAWAESASSNSAAANVLAASGALRAARNEAARNPGQSVGFDAPVLDPRDAGGTAERLAARVSNSGVFFEAHVAQSLRGDRSAESVQNEGRQLARAVLADPSRAEARTAVQLDALQRHVIALSGPAWAGQSMVLELGRDPQVLPDGANNGTAGAEPVFVARLRLELPRLSAVEVRLRLAGESVAATIQGGSIEELRRALPDFASALSARGLRPVLLQAVAPDEGAG